jgi:hypothetical protein
MLRACCVFLALTILLSTTPAQSGKENGVRIDKAKKTITIDAKVAPRKLEYLKGEIYPLEVIACWPHPKGKKAHETIVTIEAMPKYRRVPIDRTMLDSRTGKPFPKSVKWRFTGSVKAKPDPNKDDEAYGADLSGTLGVIFPVSNQTVFQTSLSMEYESIMKLETNPKVVPKEGTPVRLVIEVP